MVTAEEFKRKGVKDGYGHVEYKDGRVYQGYFKNGRFEGEGILKMKNGDLYEGNFKNNKFEGKGRIVYNDPVLESYTGRFKESKWWG